MDELEIHRQMGELGRRMAEIQRLLSTLLFMPPRNNRFSPPPERPLEVQLLIAQKRLELELVKAQMRYGMCQLGDPIALEEVNQLKQRIDVLQRPATYPEEWPAKFCEQWDLMNNNAVTELTNIYSKLLDYVKEEPAAISGDTLEETEQESYREYLKSEHWQTVREMALEFSDYHCQLCYSEDHLDVHHRTYERRGHEKLTDVTVLCHDCHAKFHDKLP